MYADFLIIGAGIAGTYFALHAAERNPDRKIIVVCKGKPEGSNSQLAQGGIASVTSDSDSFEKHLMDTMHAGDFRNNKKAVGILVNEIHTHIRRLIELGVRFDKNGKNDFHLGLEGGHSENRILHCKDETGKAILEILLKQALKKKNIVFLPGHYAISLIKEAAGGTVVCNGAHLYSEDAGRCFGVQSRITFMATGGAGQLYLNTTNPPGATGDGIALALNAGAAIKDIDMIQFHPTALYQEGISPAFLISEAVRGEGAVLRDPDNRRFMADYHHLAELAPRDKVSLAIYETMSKFRVPFIYMDCRHMNKDSFEKHFPAILKKLKSVGLDFKTDLIPVSPAAHYTCGGIETNENGETNIRNLFAGGECAYTGLHGSNRLASNSLSEALVFSYRSLLKAEILLKNKLMLPKCTVSTPIYNPGHTETGLQIIAKIKNIMWQGSGIIKSFQSLEKARQQLEDLSEVLDKVSMFHSPPLIEARNLHLLATLSIKQSLERKENTGVFYNRDLDSQKSQELSSLRHSA